MNKTWHAANGDYFLRDISSEQPLLDKAVYSLQFSPMVGFYLKKMQDEFKFDFKVYGLETGFIKKVLKTYENTRGNLGMILNGIKGTGKTITSEILANRLGIPVIIVAAKMPGMNDFLNDIPQDITILIDEYEKVFKGSISDEDYDYQPDDNGGKGDSTLLSLMDGVYKTEFRKVFLLTTNRVWVNENMVNRPGRIRYMKQFNDLERSQIEEIIDDCLVNKGFKEEVIEFLKPLKIITVDIVKAVISEVNIFEQPPSECCKILNVELKEDEYSIYEIDELGEEKFLENVPVQVAVRALGLGKNWKGNYINHESDVYYIMEKPNYKEGTFVVNREGFHIEDKDETNFKIKLRKVPATHRVFTF